MDDSIGTLYFDFVDPVSFLLDLELSAVEEDLGVTLNRVGFELRPPPEPLTDTRHVFWAKRWASAAAIADELDVTLARPPLVPWSRKAHELHLQASSRDAGSAVRAGIFRAFFSHRRDIGRIDVLVEIASRAGLELTETKANLDVDRHEAALNEARHDAIASGVENTPTIIIGDSLLEGFRNRAALSTLLARQGDP